MKRASLFTVVGRHLRYSLSHGFYKYVAFFGFVLFLTIVTSIRVKTDGGNSVTVFWELLRDKGYFERIVEYEVPFHWELFQFLPLFLIGDFLFHDLKHNQGYLLLRCRSKGHYIASYVIWIVIQNIGLFFGIFLLIYVVSSILVGDFSLHTHGVLPVSISGLSFILRLFVGYVLVGIVLSSIQLLGMQVWSGILIFLLTIFVSSLSTFLNNQWLPAIHSMILKQAVFNPKYKLTLTTSIVHTMTLYIAITCITIFIFRKKDIL